MSHSESWYEVSSLVVVGAGWRSLHRRPHPVLVVLADEDARQLPQGGHVERLEQLALIGSDGTGGQTNVFTLTVRDFLSLWQDLYLIGCPVSVECDTHLVVALVLAGQSDASSQGNLNTTSHFSGAKTWLFSVSVKAAELPKFQCFTVSLPERPRCRCRRRNAERTCALILLCLWPRLLYDLRKNEDEEWCHCSQVQASSTVLGLLKNKTLPHLWAQPGSPWWPRRGCTCIRGHGRQWWGGRRGWWRLRCLLHTLPVEEQRFNYE